MGTPLRDARRRGERDCSTEDVVRRRSARRAFGQPALLTGRCRGARLAREPGGRGGFCRAVRSDRNGSKRIRERLERPRASETARDVSSPDAHVSVVAVPVPGDGRSGVLGRGRRVAGRRVREARAADGERGERLGVCARRDDRREFMPGRVFGGGARRARAAKRALRRLGDARRKLVKSRRAVRLPHAPRAAGAGARAERAGDALPRGADGAGARERAAVRGVQPAVRALKSSERKRRRLDRTAGRVFVRVKRFRYVRRGGFVL
jgi:hypothetical protein